jgi:membrane protein
MKLSKRVGWKKKLAAYLHILLDALRKFDKDHGFFLSSGITFNLLICLVPFLLLLLALMGTYLYSDRTVLNHIRQYLENVAPSLDPRIMKNILRIIRDRKIVGILGIAGLIWTSTWVFSSLRIALNIIFEVEKGRGIVRGKVIDLLMIFLVGIFLLVSMTVTSLITYIQGYHFTSPLDIGPVIRFLLKYAIPFFFSFWMFFLIYKIVPNKKVSLKSALQATCFTSLLWETAKQFFGWYVLHLGRFSMIYGSLSTLTIFFLWIYYSSVIVILGGEVAFLLEKKNGIKAKTKREFKVMMKSRHELLVAENLLGRRVLNVFLGLK